MISAKKSLGQNWLNSPSAIKKIIEASQLTTGELVVEIGPGKGALTKELLATGVTVIAIEIDAELLASLNLEFAAEIKSGQLTLINADILTLKPEEITSHKPYKLIANIPYYITGAIFTHFLQTLHQPTLITLLVQKEVARRIMATDKKESILSLSVKIFGEPKYIATVPAGAFIPAPKVDSAILAIYNIKNNLSAPETKRFFTLIKQGFSGKRKQLKNNLPNHVEAISQCGLVATIRAEDLTLPNWLCLLNSR